MRLSITVILAADEFGAADCVAFQAGEFQHRTGRVYSPVFAVGDDFGSQVVGAGQRWTLRYTENTATVVTDTGHGKEKEH